MAPIQLTNGYQVNRSDKEAHPGSKSHRVNNNIMTVRDLEEKTSDKFEDKRVSKNNTGKVRRYSLDSA